MKERNTDGESEKEGKSVTENAAQSKFWGNEMIMKRNTRKKNKGSIGSKRRRMKKRRS